jgi:hypothetical protein
LAEGRIIRWYNLVTDIDERKRAEDELGKAFDQHSSWHHIHAGRLHSGSDSDPHDMTSIPIEVGPHWMIMWPFDPKTTGLPTTHKPTGAYIMWAGSPYAHLHVMGRP